MFSRKFNTGSLPIPIPIFCFIFYWWSRSRLCNTAPYATECTLYTVQYTAPLFLVLLVPAHDGSFSSSSLSSCFPAPSVSRIFGPPGNKMTQISALALQQFLIFFSPNNNALDTHTGIYCIY